MFLLMLTSGLQTCIDGACTRSPSRSVHAARVVLTRACVGWPRRVQHRGVELHLPARPAELLSGRAEQRDTSTPPAQNSPTLLSSTLCPTEALGFSSANTGRVWLGVQYLTFAGVKIIMGGLLGKPLMRNFGQLGLTTFSNFANFIVSKPCA